MTHNKHDYYLYYIIREYFCGKKKRRSYRIYKSESDYKFGHGITVTREEFNESYKRSCIEVRRRKKAGEKI
jgi:hypothetical protein